MGLVQTAGYQGGSPRHVLQPQCWDAVLVEVERRNLAPGCASSGAVPLFAVGEPDGGVGSSGLSPPATARSGTRRPSHADEDSHLTAAGWSLRTTLSGSIAVFTE